MSINGIIPKLALRGNRSARLSYPEGWFRAGNQEALASLLTEEANLKRLKALLRGYHTAARLRSGEQLVTKNQIRKAKKRQRFKLHMTVAKEAREIQDTARRHAAAAMTRLATIMETSVNEAASIAAATVILDRAYGKANQTNINATVDANGKATEVSSKELDTRIEQALKRVEAITGRAPKAPPSKDEPTDVRKLDRDPNSSTQH